jgi:protein gp37
MKNSKIEWTHHTFNPWIGCTRVSPACDNCYAAVSTPARTMKINWGAGQPRKRTSDANWREPLRWNADCAERGVRERVFCASLADVFDNEVPHTWRRDLFRLFRATPNLDHLVLTKRIGNAFRMTQDAYGFETPNPGCYSPMRNVWLGATICNQEEADRDIPKLLAVPAAKRFLSIEPLLGPVDLSWAFADIRTASCHTCGYRTNQVGGVCPNDNTTLRGDFGIDWVIVGGESGPNARPMHPDWARSLRDQCQAARVPFFFKQWGEWIPYEDSVQPPFKFSQHGHQIDGHLLPDFESEDGQLQREWLCDWHSMLLARRVGKKAAGRMLDGREWNEVPA